tara:strand:+ start:75 stop:650 length:576 start_codon:yes stop_codon:yes gene_type:complete
MQLSKREKTLLFAGIISVSELGKLKHRNITGLDRVLISDCVVTLSMMLLYSNIKHDDEETLKDIFNMSKDAAFLDQLLNAEIKDVNTITRASSLTTFSISCFRIVLNSLKKLNLARFKTEEFETIKKIVILISNALLASKAGHVDNDLTHSTNELIMIITDNADRMQKNINLLVRLNLSKRYVTKVQNKLL